MSHQLPTPPSGARPRRPENVTLKDTVTGEANTIKYVDLIDAMRHRDEMSAVNGNRFPRVCRGCGNEDPLRLAVSIGCGHVVCRACSDETSICPHSECRERNNGKSTKFIAIFENEDKTRDCGVCLNTSPVVRMVLTACGHIICQPCFHLVRYNLVRYNYSLAPSIINCPFCRVETDFEKMKEEMIGEVIIPYIPIVQSNDK